MAPFRMIAVVICLFYWTASGHCEEPAFDTARIEALTGLKGSYQEAEDVFKVTSPRSDLPVKVDQVAMPPFMGFTSWAAFTPGKQEPLMVMGDLVLLEDEVNPVMSVALGEGLQVTALHNHFFYDVPKVYFMHIGGEGSLEQLASAVGKAMAKVKAIREAQKEHANGFEGPGRPDKNAISSQPLEAVFEAKSTAKDGMCKFVWGRKVKMECGCEAGKEMGVNTWAAFGGTDESAVVCGDFAVLESELQPVLKSLRGSGINIVAIHHHMVGESPRTLFLHYWGRGKAADLAKALKAAKNVQDRQP
ncbi:MAG: DUF1259 domain-containing protein [Planctomycetes bacterium]|nr:DUF1259 domain-containing protein [Planctomycetota bacterium]